MNNCIEVTKIVDGNISKVFAHRGDLGKLPDKITTSVKIRIKARNHVTFLDQHGNQHRTNVSGMTGH
jgi:hypothetical protein